MGNKTPNKFCSKRETFISRQKALHQKKKKKAKERKRNWKHFLNLCKINKITLKIIPSNPNISKLKNFLKTLRSKKIAKTHPFTGPLAAFLKKNNIPPPPWFESKCRIGLNGPSIKPILLLTLYYLTLILFILYYFILNL